MTGAGGGSQGIVALCQGGEPLPEQFQSVFEGHLVAETPMDEACAHAQVLLVVAAESRCLADTLSAVRGLPALFLKPVLAIGPADAPDCSEMADELLVGTASAAAAAEALKAAVETAGRVAALASASGRWQDPRAREILLLRFLLTRPGSSLQPVPDVTSTFGYGYPLVGALLRCSAGAELGCLKALSRRHLLAADLVDRVHVCPFCHHSRVNFAEVCPKCNKQLGHLGAEDDRPGRDRWCSTCMERVGQTEAQCLCLNCSAVFAPGAAELKDVCRFGLTDEGRTAAADGACPAITVSEILTGRYGMYRREVFEELLRLECLRCRRYGYDSTLVRLSLEPLDQALADQKAEVTGRAVRQLRQLLAQTFRRTDILTELDEGELLVIFTHTDAVSAGKGLSRLEGNIGEAFGQQVELDFEAFGLGDEEWPLGAILGA